MSGKQLSLLSGHHLYWALYVLLVSLRTSFVFIAPGYIHPDEFFQSVELAAHDLYPDTCSLQTWEFKVVGHGPVRSRASIWPFVHFPININNWVFPISNTSRFIGNEQIKRLLYPSRIITLLLSFIPDAFVFHLSCKLRSNPHQFPLSLLLYSSMAYGGMLFNTRTLSNVWETIMVCAVCFLSLRTGVISVIIQCVVTTWSIFLRPSFPIFVLPFFIRQFTVMLHSRNCCRNLFPLMLAGILPALAIGILITYNDTVYYLRSKPQAVSDLILTPFKFLTYNSAAATVGEHGLHPWYHYVFIHWPVIMNPILAVTALLPPYRKRHNDGLRYTTWASLVLPTVALSFIGHKEARFLLPSIPFACVLAASRMKSIKHFLMWCFAYQMALVGFWGFAHQGGLLNFMHSLSPTDDVSLNLFYKTYMPPRFPFGGAASLSSVVPQVCRKLVDFDPGCMQVVDFAGNPEPDLFSFLSCLKSNGQINTTFRLILPGSILPLQLPISHFGRIVQTNTYFPHLSTENLPKLYLTNCSYDANILSCFLSYLERLKLQLSLHVYKIVNFQ